MRPINAAKPGACARDLIVRPKRLLAASSARQRRANARPGGYVMSMPRRLAVGPHTESELQKVELGVQGDKPGDHLPELARGMIPEDDVELDSPFGHAFDGRHVI